MKTKQTADDSPMSELTVVEFESKTFGNSYVSELSDGPPYTVHGVALGAGDITVGQSGIKKKWPAAELETAADSLRGTNLVVDHNNDATGVVGRVTKSGYKEDTGVVYEAELYDEELAEKIQSGLLEVSIRGFHADVDSLEEDEETDAKIVEDIQFDNLSIVPTGAAPSNTLEMGAHAELSPAELSAFTDTLEAAELAEIEPGMWVEWGDKRGITISQVQDGEIEVDVYAESDGKWRSTGNTEMVETDTLSEWDVNEDEDIGSAQDSGSDSEEEMAATNDKVTWDSSGGMAEGVVRERKTDGCFNEKIDGDQEVCASEDEAVVLIEIVKDGEPTGTMVAHKEGTVTKADFEMSAGEQLEPASGDFVQWKGVNDEPQFGQIVSINQDGQQMVAEIRRHTKNGDALDELVEKPVQGLERWDQMNADSDYESTPDDMRDDSAGGMQAPTWEDGQMVKWQVNPAMKGKIVHVDRDKKVLMVEVMEDTEQGMQPTGYTLTSGFQDVVPMDKEMAATTTRDVPTQDAQPEHDTDSVNNLLKRFIEEQSDSQPSLADFVDWMASENLSIERGEGEEEYLDTSQKVRESREGEPHRYIDAEDEASELAETYSDYPEAASDNAQMALDAREETDNPNDCGTQVGWRRANQLASGEALSRETIAKMSAFNRHRSNSDKGDDGKADCGWMMWKAWGGDEGIDWAQSKLESIEEENSMHDVPDKHMFKNKEDAQDKADDLGLNGVHEMDGRWMPGETHEEYMDNVASTSGHMDEEESDEEEMASREDMEDALSIVNNFLDTDGAEDSSISEFLEWADSDPPVKSVVNTFTNTIEDGSKESDVRRLVEWLNGELTNERDTDKDEESSDSEEENGKPSSASENSVDEGDEASDAEELQDYEMHTPDWSGTTESEWSRPALEDFDTDDLSEVAKHFLISSSGFPPENFSDLKLPVVEPNGDLNINALSAVKGGRGVSAVDGLASKMEQDIVDWVNSKANSEFDKSWGEDSEENEQADAHDSDTAGRPTPGENTVGGVRVLSGDDLQQKSYKTGESDADSLETYKITTMTSDIEEKLSELDEPVAVEAEEVEELRNKADRFEEMSENLEALRERTDILDEVDRSQVEALADAEDPVVEESARYEELQSEAEQVKGVYAAQLAEEYPAFTAEELTDKFSIEELREKFEEQIGDVEEELASSDDAEPRSQDADEESLEEASEESDDSAEEELADEAAAKQEELKSKILGGR